MLAVGNWHPSLHLVQHTPPGVLGRALQHGTACCRTVTCARSFRLPTQGMLQSWPRCTGSQPSPRPSPAPKGKPRTRRSARLAGQETAGLQPGEHSWSEAAVLWERAPSLFCLLATVPAQPLLLQHAVPMLLQLSRVTPMRQCHVL